MAETDHGELLTKFEEIFGSLVEHEVIKMVLQQCEWHSESAYDNLLNMVDLEQLPVHIRNALTAESAVHSSPLNCQNQTGYQTACLLPVERSVDNHAPIQSQYNESVHSEVEEILRSASRSRDNSPLGSTSSDCSTGRPTVNRLSQGKETLSSTVKPNCHKSTITPFALAQNTIANQPYFSNHLLTPLSASTGRPTVTGSTGNLQSSPRPRPSDDRELSVEIDSFFNKESNSSLSPSPPITTAPAAEIEDRKFHIPDSSQWILAPEFVPNAFNQGRLQDRIWPINATNSFTSISQESTSNVPLDNGSKVKSSKKEEIIRKILSPENMLILMRGLPGSGKSTLAKEVKGHSGVILSTDDFFNRHGKYVYEPKRLQEAHAWNFNRARKNLQEQRSPIIIDNTNLQVWEMKPYVKLALQNGYEVDILEPETPWKLSPKELSRRNTHGVPKDKIKEMRDRYDPEIRIEHVIASITDGKKSGNIIRASKESLPSGNRTDWPTTLPELDKNRKPHRNGNTQTQPEIGSINDNSIGLSSEDSVARNEDLPVVKCDNDMGEISVNNSSLAYLEIYQSDDDADVIVEGYEDILQNGTDTANDLTKLAVLTKTAESDYNVDEADRNVEASPTSSCEQLLLAEETSATDVSSDFCKEELTPASYKDVENDKLCDEEKVKILIEEANIEVDEESVKDWDDLVLKADEEMSDEKFHELVLDLGTSVRSELEKKASFNGQRNTIMTHDDEHSEDLAMYEFCIDMEDKIGKSLSSVLSRPSDTDESMSSFFIIKENNLEGKSLVVDNSKTTEIPEDQCKIHGDKVNHMISNSICKNLNNRTETSIENHISSICQDKENDELQEDPLVLRVHKEYCISKEVSIVKDEALNANEILNSSNRLDDASHINNQNDADISSSTMTSWECLDIKDGVSSESWNAGDKESGDEKDLKRPKPTRDHRRRPNGNPEKWLYPEDGSSPINKDTNECLWEAGTQGAVESWDDTNSVRDRPTNTPVRDVQPLPHTGAVPKMRKGDIKQSTSVTSMMLSHNSGQNEHLINNVGLPPLTKSPTLNISNSKEVTNDKISSKKTTADGETQTLSIDFQAAQLDNNLYELKILYGSPDYTPACNSTGMLLENGPLTKGKLSLDKGTMTESLVETTLVKPLHNLVRFFPNIPEAELSDVLEKCKNDLDWAMNILLDDGYEMADSVDLCDSQDGSDIALEDMEMRSDMNGMMDNISDRFTEADLRNVEPLLEEKSRKVKQSQDPEDLVSKKEIENSFTFTESVDDRVTRLTGKDFEKLNMSKVKQRKSKKKHSKKKHAEGSSVTSSKDAISWEEGGGAQYVTLLMDSLFASQLVSMFGPIGSCGMSGEMEPEDRSVILPLELCHQIHKYWTKTLDGKFRYEAEVLDSIVREDESLARRLQEEEEELASKSNNLVTNSSSLDNSEKVFQDDPPTNLKEIMDLEQALLESQGEQNINSDASLSSHLNLQRLYAEFPHVDKEAMKQEFTESGFNYKVTLQRICSRYGAEQSTPKTVIAPEFLEHYEQQMIEKAQTLSLAQNIEDLEDQMDEEDLEPDNPQVYRDEAQMHYHQRQEFYKKAQDAHRQGMKAAAAYYANLGKIHSEKLNEANQRASMKILEAVNSQRDANVLDLHLLHVPEALSATQAFLAEREHLLAARNISQMQVSLITGRGAHSVGGQARLKPAVENFLQKKGYSFQEGNSGMFVVTIKR